MIDDVRADLYGTAANYAAKRVQTATPGATGDAANKGYVDTAVTTAVAAIPTVPAATAATATANGTAGKVALAADNNTTARNLAATPAGVAAQVAVVKTAVTPGGGRLLRAWAAMNAATILTSSGIASCTKGSYDYDFTLTFSTAAPNTNYTVLGTASGVLGEAYRYVSVASKTVNSVRVLVTDGYNQAPEKWDIAIFY
jgi:hypothetical protein